MGGQSSEIPSWFETRSAKGTPKGDFGPSMSPKRRRVIRVLTAIFTDGSQQARDVRQLFCVGHPSCSQNTRLLPTFAFLFSCPTGQLHKVRKEGFSFLRIVLVPLTEAWLKIKCTKTGMGYLFLFVDTEVARHDLAKYTSDGLHDFVHELGFTKKSAAPVTNNSPPSDEL